MASEWNCPPEERTSPLSCSDVDFYGIVTIEGSTGCVTMIGPDVLYLAESDCLHNQNGDVILRDDNSAERCTEVSCGTEFGCF